MSEPLLSYTADFIHIEEALKDEWVEFLRLNEEMDKFEPKPLESFDDFRSNEFDRLKKLNPDTEDQELLNLIDGQISHMSSFDAQFYSRFSRPLWSQNIKITTIAHALCEAQINAVLAIGLSRINAVELFDIIEKADLKKKWLYAPKSFFADYEFPIGSGLHETLVSLIKHRNSLVHYKIELTIGNEKVLDGSKIRRSAVQEDRNWLHRYCSLPFDLSQFLFKAIEKPKIMILFDRHPIQEVSAHVT